VIVIVGRSSSHFTRTTRIFASELAVPYEFRAVLDMATLDRTVYGDNPALKVPVLVDEDGPLFGTENICRALAMRSGQRERVVLRGDVTGRLVANAEELLLHAMSNDVTLIMTAAPGDERPPPHKVRPCLVRHLPFRKLMDTSGYARLQDFCQEFEQRPGAASTAYRFDTA